MQSAVPAADVGRNIQTARVAAGLTRDDLAYAAGLAVTTVWRIERGAVAPGIGTLSRIAQALNVTVDHLLQVAS